MGENYPAHRGGNLSRHEGSPFPQAQSLYHTLSAKALSFYYTVLFFCFLDYLKSNSAAFRADPFSLFMKSSSYLLHFGLAPGTMHRLKIK